MGVEQFIGLVGNAGITIALVVFFVWKDSREKSDLTKRLTEVENFQRDKMTRMITENTTALHETSQVMHKLCGKIDSLKTAQS